MGLLSAVREPEVDDVVMGESLIIREPSASGFGVVSSSASSAVFVRVDVEVWASRSIAEEVCNRRDRADVAIDIDIDPTVGRDHIGAAITLWPARRPPAWGAFAFAVEVEIDRWASGSSWIARRLPLSTACHEAEGAAAAGAG